MRHTAFRAATLGVVLALAWAARDARAQSGGDGHTTTLPKERVHPELVDTTWGRRTTAAWHLAWAQQWRDARRAFGALHDEQPDAVEPMLGLAFVERATWHYDSARRWYARAAAVEPTEDVRRQLAQAQWDRAGRLAPQIAPTDAAGERSTDWAVETTVPINRWGSLTGRVGVLGAGNPELGIFVDSANQGTRTTMFSIGGIGRPTDRITISGRFEQWTSNGSNVRFGWLDAANRITDWIAIHGLARVPSSDSTAVRFGAAMDVITQRKNLLTFEVWQSTRATEFEARSAARVVDILTPNVRSEVRGELAFDIGPTNAATTGVLSGTWYFVPTVGARAEVSRRSGAFPRTSVLAGAELRW